MKNLNNAKIRTFRCFENLTIAFSRKSKNGNQFNPAELIGNNRTAL